MHNVFPKKIREEGRIHPLFGFRFFSPEKKNVEILKEKGLLGKFTGLWLNYVAIEDQVFFN